MSQLREFILPSRALSPHNTILEAISILQEEHSAGLPVTDADERVVGFFSTYSLIAQLLPKAMTDHQLGLHDLAFVSDSTARS